MKIVIFSIDLVTGFIAMGSFVVGMGAYFRSDIDTRDKCIKIFALCVLALTILAVVAAVFGLPMTGFTFPDHQ